MFDLLTKMGCLIYSSHLSRALSRLAHQAAMFEQAGALLSESVIHVVGVVRARPADMVNPRMPSGWASQIVISLVSGLCFQIVHFLEGMTTGALEIEVELYSILNPSELVSPIPVATEIGSSAELLPVFATPFESSIPPAQSQPSRQNHQQHLSSSLQSLPSSSSSSSAFSYSFPASLLSSSSSSQTSQPASTGFNLASEEVRLRYRYLDLRRASLQKNLRLRAQIALAVRNYFAENGSSSIYFFQTQMFRLPSMPRILSSS